MRKLELRRETIKELTQAELHKVAGGITMPSCPCDTESQCPNGCGPHQSACDCMASTD